MKEKVPDVQTGLDRAKVRRLKKQVDTKRVQNKYLNGC